MKDCFENRTGEQRQSKQNIMHPSEKKSVKTTSEKLISVRNKKMSNTVLGTKGRSTAVEENVST